MRNSLKNNCYYLSIILGILLQVSCGPNIPDSIAEDYEALPDKLDFNVHVKPILSDKCYACHGPDKAKQKAGLHLDEPEAAYGELPETPGKFAIVPGDLESSEAIRRILSNDPAVIMPTPEFNVPLSDYEKAVLVKWVEQGAEYKPHWAFIKPKLPKIPKVKQEDKVANAIDNFVVAKLEEQKLQPSEKASKEILLRRVSFDLIGLPPTIEEIEAFVNDDAPNAFEKQVDRLLASPHYGEQRTLDWMDVARYADTHGYSVDKYRDTSPWRDWVIKSFNKNMPYDKFLDWQIAGDMFENATREQRLATTFSRLHPQNLEGGIIDEEFRSEYVADRTATISQGILGLSYACAKCHDHKYDPISQKNYYEMYSYFNNLDETGLIPWDLATPVPAMLLPTEKQEEVLDSLGVTVKETEAKLVKTLEKETANALKWLLDDSHKEVSKNKTRKGLVAAFDFNNKKLVNTAGGNGKNKIRLRTQFVDNRKAYYTEGASGKGLAFNGDDWLDLDKIGIYKRNEPFSIGIKVYVPKDLSTGVVFHKMQGPELHSYRGYHLQIKDNKLEVMLAHVYPDNAIVVQSLKEIPKETWVQLTMTYDGSSKAKGVHIYMDGEKLETETIFDNLYKDIIFNGLVTYLYDYPFEPGIRVGAIWRGKGLKGGKVDDLLVYNKELSEIEVLKISNPSALEQLKSKSYAALSDEEKQKWINYYLSEKSNDYSKTLVELTEKRRALVDSVEPIQQIMVMKERKEPRKTHILDRGQYDAPTEEVFPNMPETILAMGEEYPKNRIGLAKWIINKENPLTARVAVNRYWQNIFGRGIVKTSEDFGNQGELPSHPELLDWLALYFIDSGWDVKKLHKIIMMSNTYQQKSIVTPELLAVDKENKFIARGPSNRLTGEMLRDNAIYASGLMHMEIGGKSVRPYQPKGLWEVNGDTYEQDEGESLYRRSMYTIWKRTVPNPTISIFDTPTRDLCSSRRQKTNTPLQALVVLNDPTYIEASRVLGKQITESDTLQKGISKAFMKLTGRKITTKEMELLVNLQNSEYKKFSKNESKTKGWLETGQFKVAENDDKALIAANAVIASTIMNTDAVITKR